MSTPVEAVITSESGMERRFYPRIAPSALISVAFDEDNSGMLLNVSENGLLVSTPVPLACNFVSRVSVTLNDAAKPIEVHVRVVWTTEANRAGIQLLDLCDHDREQIRKWVALEEARAGADEETRHRETPNAPPQRRGVREPRSKEPVGAKYSRMTVIAGAVSGVVMLTMALALEGRPLRAWFARSIAAGWKDTLAMRPGGEVSDRAVESETAEGPGTAGKEGTATPETKEAIAVDPMMVPEAKAGQNVAAPESTSEKIGGALGSMESYSSARGSKAAHGKKLMAKDVAISAAKHERVGGAANTPKSAPTAVNSAVAASKGAKLPASQTVAEERAVADSADRIADSAPERSPIEEVGTKRTDPSAVVASTPRNAPNANVSQASGGTRVEPRGLQQSSAIEGSITGGGSANIPNRAPASTVPAMSAASAVPTAAPVVDPRSSRQTPVPASNDASRSSYPSPVQPVAPMSRVLEVTLPNISRATFLSLPGQQVVQSQAATVYIQRSILAPARRAWWSSERKEKVVLGELVSRVDPQPPRVTQAAGGRVSVRALLGKDGRVESLMPANGSAALVPSAVRAVREWRFEPTLLNGKPVETAAYVMVEFHPQAAGAVRQ